MPVVALVFAACVAVPLYVAAALGLLGAHLAAGPAPTLLAVSLVNSICIVGLAEAAWVQRRRPGHEAAAQAPLLAPHQ